MYYKLRRKRPRLFDHVDRNIGAKPPQVQAFGDALVRKEPRKSEFAAHVQPKRVVVDRPAALIFLSDSVTDDPPAPR